MQDFLEIAVLVLKISIVLQVVAMGLGTTWADATYLFRNPELLLKSILARNVAVPIIAVLLIQAFSLRGAVAIAIAVLAVTPVAPLIPRTQLKAGGHAEYILGLLVSQTVLAILIVPLTIQAMNWALGAQAEFSAGQVAKLMIVTILVPLGIGMLAAQLIPALRTFAPHMMTVGTVLLVLGVLPLLPLAWTAFATLSGNGTMMALAILVIASTAVGHLFGGPDPGDRTALALATSARHPALAFAIAKANFPEQASLVGGALVIYLLLRMILSVPYVRKRRPSHA